MKTKRRREPLSVAGFGLYDRLQIHSGLERYQFQVLCVIHTLERLTNRGVSNEMIRAYTGRSPKRITEITSYLRGLGYITGESLFFNQLTPKGEYFIKGLEIAYLRWIEEFRKANKWHNPKDQPKELMFPAIRKGVKLY